MCVLGSFPILCAARNDIVCIVMGQYVVEVLLAMEGEREEKNKNVITLHTYIRERIFERNGKIKGPGDVFGAFQVRIII